MSSRIRSTFASTQTMKPANQENVPTILEGKNVANMTKPVKRPALVESTNTLAQQQLAANAAAREKAKTKPVLTERPKPIITARNPIRVGARLPQTTTAPTKSLLRPSALPVPSSSRLTGTTAVTGKTVSKPLASLPVKFEKLEISKKTKEEKTEETPLSDLPDFSKIDDVDANDRDSPFLVSPYVKEIYEYLRSLERKYPINENHLLGGIITQTMRGTLVSWLVEVQVQYRLVPETLHQTIFIIDRYLQMAKTLPKSKLQLVGVTAMFIAAKYEETYCPDVDAFVYISDNAFSTRDVLEMEQKVVKSLDFAINRPLSIHFLRRYSKVAQATPLIHSYGKYFLELALLDYSVAHIPPSKIAAAAIYIALSVSKCTSLTCPSTWTPELHYYSTYSFSSIQPAINLLANTIQHVGISKKMQVVKVKYSQENLLRVSISSAVQPSRIKELLAKKWPQPE